MESKQIRTRTTTTVIRAIATLLLAITAAACLEIGEPPPYEPNGPEDTVDISQNHRQVVLRHYQTGEPVLIFNFEQTREARPGKLDDVSTTLFIQNVSSEALTFTYEIEVWSDLGYYQWSNAGYVQNLQPGMGADEGVVSTNGMNLKFAIFQIYAN